jgi:hypothetical protein
MIDDQIACDAQYPGLKTPGVRLEAAEVPVNPHKDLLGEVVGILSASGKAQTKIENEPYVRPHHAFPCPVISLQTGQYEMTIKVFRLKSFLFN